MSTGLWNSEMFYFKAHLPQPQDGAAIGAPQPQAGAATGASQPQAGAQSHGRSQEVFGAKRLRKKPLNGAAGIAQGVQPTAVSQTAAGQAGAQGAQGAQIGAGAQGPHVVHGAGAQSHGAGAQSHGQAGWNSSRKKPLNGVQIVFGPQVSQIGAQESQAGAGAGAQEPQF